MEEKLITVVVLPYSKAYIFKMQLEAKGIQCELEDVHIIQGAASTTVKVKILERHIPKVVLELESFLGSKPQITPPPEEEPQILVPVDFSPTSKKVAKLAFGIAQQLKAELVFMHSFINPIIHAMPFGEVYAYDTSALFKMEQSEKNANEEFQQFISELSDDLGKENWESVKSNIIIKSGYPEEDILAYAHKNQPKLIAVGSGGESHPHGIVGSVTADIMYNANVPVLVVPHDTPDKAITDFTKVIYATNFDEKDFTALDKLFGILEPFEINLTCVHVGLPRKNGWDMARLEGMKETIRKRYAGKNFNCVLLEGEDVLNTLETYINDFEVDIISLTTHKRSMISRLFNPSIARKMIFHSHTPLLIFHA